MNCTYRITFSLKSQLTPTTQTALSLVTDALPATGRYVLDGGTRGTGAFRVIRRQGSPIDIRGQRASVLTRRADIVPGGQSAWSQLSLTARETAGECHSGTWRDGVGPQIGNVLASAKTTLKFASKP